MNKDEILDLCRKSGFSACRKGDALSIAVMHGIESQICTIEVLNLVKLVEQATLERAANHLMAMEKKHSPMLWQETEPHSEVLSLGDSND